ncbi:MAG TPA: IS110 family transposase [Thermodesulfobacteriota bacterium]|nr:IS110 family transposase [Thermodesulfobacteriota bacterium]
MNHFNKLDFTNQPIYIGLDVHKKSWSVSIYSQHCEHKTFTQPPQVDKLVTYLRRTFPGATYQSVYEAGFSGFWIHDQLEQQGIHCMVVNPADIPTKDKEKATKTDQVDCRKLARSLRNCELEGIYVPSRIKVEDRSLVRTRQSMVRKQTRCKNQIKSILSFYGIPIPEEMENRRWSKRFINFIEQIRMEKTSGDFALKAHLDELLHLRGIIARLNKAITQLAKTEQYYDQVKLLKTIPGISTLTAMILLTELSEISRFKTLDKLASYVGLIPKTHASGEKQQQTALTKRRNSQLRALLIESSWIAVRKDPALMFSFNRLSARMKKTKAIIPIARKLLNRIRYVLKNQKPYLTSVVE